jgi:purine-binding chemotaxis protein CheW
VSRFNDLIEEFLYHPDEDPNEDFGAALGPETLTAAQPGEKPDDYLAFGLEAENYAIPIHEVREIVRVPALTEVPGSPHGLLGILNLRGDILPVYNVKPRLRLAVRHPPIAGPTADLKTLPKGARILVVHGANSDFGVLVDRVIGVIRLRPSEIEQPPARFDKERDFVLGLGRFENGIVMLLNVNQVLE